MGETRTVDRRVRRLGIAAVAAALVVGTAVGLSGGQASADLPLSGVPRATCGTGSLPETDIQGRVPVADYRSGRAAQGYRCNTVEVGHHGKRSVLASGGYKVQRYTDRSGRTCAYYDSALTLGPNVGNVVNGTGLGVVVLDMTDPAHPVKTANLVTPAMLQPHESLLVNQERGLVAAVMGTLATAPGIVDIYDASADCRHPRLMSSTPSGLFGHESGFAPDGRTFWSAGAAGYTLTAVDVSDPRKPRTLATKSGVVYHGLRLSDDGRTMYVANIGTPDVVGGKVLKAAGLDVLDVSEVQDRKPSPQIRTLSRLTWAESSIPQVAEPFRRGDRTYVFEVDEFSDLFGDMAEFDQPQSDVGAARIIDVTDPRAPRVVSNVRLEVHDPQLRDAELMADPGGRLVIHDYAAHYCSVPTRDNPRIAGCSMIASGLRLFDISDVAHPREVGYFNVPGPDGASALSQPAWDVARRQVWYTDSDEGFFVVGLRGTAASLLGPSRPCGAVPSLPGKDTDHDGLSDRREIRGVRVRQRVYGDPGRPTRGRPIGRVRTDPCRRDSDRDGLGDGREVRGIHIDQRIGRSAADGGPYRITRRRTDPTRRDTDRDGLADRQEAKGSANRRHGRHRSDPTRADTDFAGVEDGAEVRHHTDPATAGS